MQMQNLCEESIQMNHAMRFTNVCALQITGIFAPLFNAPKKHVLNFFALEEAREQRAHGRIFFQT